MMMIVFMNKCLKKRCFGLTIWLPWWWWLWWWWLPNPKSGPVGRNRVPSCHILYQLWYQWAVFDKFNSNINHEVNENGLINSIQISIMMSVSEWGLQISSRTLNLDCSGRCLTLNAGNWRDCKFNSIWLSIGLNQDLWPENLNPDSFFRTQTDYCSTFFYVSIHFVVNLCLLNFRWIASVHNTESRISPQYLLYLQYKLQYLSFNYKIILQAYKKHPIGQLLELPLLTDFLVKFTVRDISISIFILYLTISV